MAYGFNPNGLLDTFSPTALRERVAIVTGGGTGIGQGIALEMSRVGANIVVAARNLERLERTAEEIQARGRRALAIQCDVRDTDQIQNVVDKTIQEFGKIDILVNNAAGRFNIPSEDLSYNGWHSVVNIVLHGTWYFSQAVAKQMIKQGGGNIINIISNSAWLGSSHVIHSAASKSAVWNLTKTLGAEWGKYNIRVNSISPAWIWTREVQRAADIDGGGRTILRAAGAGGGLCDTPAAVRPQGDRSPAGVTHRSPGAGAGAGLLGRSREAGHPGG